MIDARVPPMPDRIDCVEQRLHVADATPRIVNVQLDETAGQFRSHAESLGRARPAACP